MEADVVTRAPEQAKDLYFPDGDIILCAPSAVREKTILLRVHRVVLSLYSPVFKDMFSLPSDPAVNDTLDSVPVVRMPDDADDLEILVSTFYRPANLRYDKRDRHKRSELRSLLSLSTKYQVDALRAQAVRYLESEWPITLEDWFFHRASMSERSRYIKVVEGDDVGDPAENFFPEPATDLRLALDFDIPAILPALYYRLAIGNMAYDFGEYFDDSEEHLTANWSLLEARDWMRISRGKEHLFNKAGDLSMVFHNIPGDWCEQKQSCKASTEGQVAALRAHRSVDFARRPDLVAIILEMLEDVSKTRYSFRPMYCIYCMHVVELKLRNAAKEIWGELAEIFSLLEDDSE
ncbi:hypothetical protein PsYK624_129870 [Phanerochaete sordida]|uniref:BTB domain-containing protein n=1 Tax=Phanerochaete sordida TaxID=48140 RepID=A0A9P3GL71_9APHY|nr:hypothetical protein PsYK624_129870 [Phanerochaete sordida]